MGYFSPSVFGNDFVADTVLDLQDLLDIETLRPGPWETDKVAAARACLDENLVAIWGHLNSAEALWADVMPTPMRAQLLASLVMENGAKMPDWLRQAALDAARQDTVLRMAGRRAVMKDFAARLASYRDGVPSFEGGVIPQPITVQG